jgi:hypothetical protein
VLVAVVLEVLEQLACHGMRVQICQDEIASKKPPLHGGHLCREPCIARRERRQQAVGGTRCHGSEEVDTHDTATVCSEQRTDL